MHLKPIEFFREIQHWLKLEGRKILGLKNHVEVSTFQGATCVPKPMLKSGNAIGFQPAKAWCGWDITDKLKNKIKQYVILNMSNTFSWKAVSWFVKFALCELVFMALPMVNTRFSINRDKLKSWTAPKILNFSLAFTTIFFRALSNWKRDERIILQKNKTKQNKRKQKQERKRKSFCYYYSML